jgi:hypothetical protein
MTNPKGKIVETIEFDKSIYQFRDDGIVLISIKDGVHVELEDSLAEYDVLIEKKEYLPLRVLIRSGDDTTVSKEVRDYANSAEARSLMNAQALVVNTLAQKIMANFILNFYKVPVKIKLFTNELDAINWLEQQ